MRAGPRRGARWRASARRGSRSPWRSPRARRRSRTQRRRRARRSRDAATAAARSSPSAAEKPIVVWPTLTPAGDDVGATAIHKPAPTEGSVYARAQELDATLRDAVQDLGFTLDVADPGPSMGRARDLDMIERAKHSARRGRARRRGHLGRQRRGSSRSAATRSSCASSSCRRRAAAPRARRAVARRGRLRARPRPPARSARHDARPRRETRARGRRSPPARRSCRRCARKAAPCSRRTPRSSARYVAFSIQRASGSDDPRLLYPLLTLGTGIGLGSALLVAEEWNVGTGDAWTLVRRRVVGRRAGARSSRTDGRCSRSPIATRGASAAVSSGIGLATFAAHARARPTRATPFSSTPAPRSGSASARSATSSTAASSNETPVHRRRATARRSASSRGGTLATFVQVSPSRVLLIDLGAGLGAAAGAAAREPARLRELSPDEDARIRRRDRERDARRRRGRLVAHADDAAGEDHRKVRLVPFGGTNRRVGHARRACPRLRARPPWDMVS